MGAGVSTKALEDFDAALKGSDGSDGSDRLVVGHCELLTLPPKMLERATHLKELRLEHAKLKQLPASFGCLVLLEYVLPGGF
jgi:leucine-rich repeat protein SHOC2